LVFDGCNGTGDDLKVLIEKLPIFIACDFLDEFGPDLASHASILVVDPKPLPIGSQSVDLIAFAKK